MRCCVQNWTDGTLRGNHNAVQSRKLMSRIRCAQHQVDCDALAFNLGEEERGIPDLVRTFLEEKRWVVMLRSLPLAAILSMPDRALELFSQRLRFFWCP